jgi:ferredoxin-fold anticodon binding domain-containing protein
MNKDDDEALNTCGGTRFHNSVCRNISISEASADKTKYPYVKHVTPDKLNTSKIRRKKTPKMGALKLNLLS